MTQGQTVMARLPDSDYELLAVTDVAARLGVSGSTVHRLIRSGELRSIKVGHSRRVPVGSLRGYLDGREVVIPADHWPPTAALW